MVKLQPPYRQYITGKEPTHAPTATLHENFESLDKQLLETLLTSAGMMNKGKPTRKAIETSTMDSCGNIALWNILRVQKLLATAGVNTKRKYANQNKELNIPPGEFGSLTTVATYFNVSSQKIGLWLKNDLMLRKDDGEPTEKCLKDGLARVVVMPGKRNKNKKPYIQWDISRIVPMLHNAGHPLDFDYEKSLKGKGKNSDVKVSVIDERVNDFLREFAPLYNARHTDVHKLVSKTPTMILQRAETKLGREGFLTQGKYKNKL